MNPDHAGRGVPPSDPDFTTSDLEPRVHWPYGAEDCRARLDLAAIEPLAVRVLARGLLTQRLVAFVGAGVSAAYGRMTWTGLMRLLWDRVEADVKGAPPGSPAEQAWARTRRDLWKGEVTAFLDYSDHAIKAQVLSSIAALLPARDEGEADDGRGKAELLQHETNWYLEDFHGFVDSVVKQVSQTNDDFELKEHRDSRRRLAREHERDVIKSGWLSESPAGLKPVLKALSDIERSLPKPSATSGPTATAKSIIEALSHQPRSLESPLRLLANEWGIRRFMTTNYDREIERGLGAVGFAAAGERDAKVNANQFDVLNFSKNVTGQVLRFALEGPRRHAAVLHLHGDVTDARSLIVTESHYQHLYLDDHPLRDLVNNATLANFAANSILFVGSDVSEDDVLRPMRQFMTGEGHRRDRMAVALFITGKSPEVRAQRRVELWLRYGVYAIDIGAAKVGSDTKDGLEPLWLVRLTNLQRQFRSPVVPGDVKGPERATAVLRKRRDVAAAIEGLGVPVEVEGVDVERVRAFDFRAELERLAKLIAQLPDSVDESSFQLRRAMLLFDATVSWISGCFLCAKLINLRERATKVIEDDVRLALRYKRPRHAYKAPDAKLPGLNVRHAVLQAHPQLHGRFEMIAAAEDQSFDEGIGDLCKAIKSCDPFQKMKPLHRRVVIVCATRGQGKGGQCDRLVATKERDAGYPYLRQMLNAFGGYAIRPNTEAFPKARIVHANLSFSNELGTIIGQVIGVMRAMLWPENPPKESNDQLEELGRCMHGLSLSKGQGRLLLVLGNAGVLFDADGVPKNGQIRRVMRTLLAERFAEAKMDILMYVGESQMPAAQRIKKPEKDQAATAPKDVPSLSAEVGDMRRRRRLHRLRINGQPPAGPGDILVHALRGARVSQLARAYFPNVAVAMAWNRSAPSHSASDGLEPPDKGSLAYDLAIRLYRAAGGSRFGQTLILAWLETAAWLHDDPTKLSNARAPTQMAEQAAELVFASLRSVPAASAVEAVVEFVLDRWGALHQIGTHLPDWVLPRQRDENQVPTILEGVRKLCHPLTPAGWSLATEVLWHLSAFSHPVEANVLEACPRIANAATDLSHRLRIGPLQCIQAMLELLVHWCLLFRVCKRPLPMHGEDDGSIPGIDAESRIRYAPHRHLQRHFLRLMGGRNVEATSWDQFTTTIYASLPDESPLFRPEVHQTLVDVVQGLTEYPKLTRKQMSLSAAPRSRGPSSVQQAVREADRIRAAYYLVRSTYSLGVVSHLTAEASDRVGTLGHMEQYRRLVRWITHAARYWETRHGIHRTNAPEGASLAHGWCTGKDRQGLFYPGELVWLYNECGVISLAQGKLHDAEQLLTMAESAARMVEADDSGSLHTRIRIQAALVQIERGRPHRASQILKPISERNSEYQVPPLLATFYLGMVEHLGGSYEQALGHYAKALKGLRQHGRARAAAFVLMNRADIEFWLHPDKVEVALATADEAISLAQQGGHEDLRVMATVGRARICVDADRTANQHIFEQLNFAQRYAVLMDIPRLACDVHELRARLLMRQGEYHLSANDATAGLEIAAMYDLKLKKARGLLTLSEIYLRRGETDGARSLAAMGREIAVSCDYYACVRGFKDLELMLHPPSAVYL